MPETINMKPGMKAMPCEAHSVAHLTNASLDNINITTAQILDEETKGLILSKHSLHGYYPYYISLVDLFRIYFKN
jgi:hypothetical protein